MLIAHPSEVRVTLGGELGVGGEAAAGEVDGDLLEVVLAHGQRQLRVVHQRRVGDVQRRGAAQARARQQDVRLMPMRVDSSSDLRCEKGILRGQQEVWWPVELWSVIVTRGKLVQT